jgi:trans-aconitate methyltransferase
LIRYRLAAGFTEPGDTVLDAACGVGYGAEVFQRFPVHYIGVDKEPISQSVKDCQFIQADLTEWEPDFEFDIGVSFETIEHLSLYEHLLSVLKQAKRWMIVSVPVVPTKHVNPFHLHDFQPQELPNLVADDKWEYYQYLGQPTEFSEIYVFRRVS